jgi:phosphoenolpyruvate carboxykinase (ATP)
MTSGRGNPAFRSDEPSITGIGPVHCNLTEPALIKAALQRHEGRLGKGGAFLVPTGSHTGRFLKDKPVVRTAFVENSIWWGNNASQTPDAFDRLYGDVPAHLRGRMRRIVWTCAR